jgi:RNA polymerase sigma factor (sigma-70 family)
VGSDGQAQAEFDAAYPSLVSAADYAIGKFFRYDESLIEDAVVETMARTYERWERFRRHDDPIGWVAACAKNVCLEQLRETARRPPSSTDADEAGNVVALADTAAVSATICRALDRLSRHQRDVVVLRYLMGFDEATTAAAIGTTIAKVKSVASDARRRIGVLLADVYRDPDEVAI